MRIKSFPHGIHPPENKALTVDKKLEFFDPPEKVFIPLLQHFGKPAEPLVKKGDEVYLGQKIGKASALFSSAVHSSVSGKVLSVDSYSHPLGKPLPAVTIANDGEDRLHPNGQEQKSPFSLDPEEIREKVKEAGIVGLGGATFPTAVKLTPPKDKSIDTIIINGCECEPVLTGDYRLMLEYPADILNGAELIRIATGAKRIMIGIEDNKKAAFEALASERIDHKVEVNLLKTKYPQGAEKNLIYALLHREVPKGGLPFDVGVVVQNVGTTKAIWDAINQGKSLYERALTVSGSCIKEPKNLFVRVGTPFQNVIDFCGGFTDNANILIMGGPMMGLSQWTSEVPVIKGTSGILAWETPSQPIEYACIRCSRCVNHCPMNLIPTQLMKYAKFDYLEEAEGWGILDCVECGSCQFTCPAKIPLVHWIRLGKSKTMALKRKKSA